MPRKTNKNLLTYPDGVCSVMTVEGRKITGIRQAHLRYGEESVGVARFWNAQLASSQIDRAIRIPYEAQVGQRDLVLIGDRQYKIQQIQLKELGDQRYWHLSLTSVQTPYGEVSS